MLVVTAVLAGVLIGLSLGALGAGGSILAVPVLVYLLGQTPLQATTGSLVVVGTGPAGVVLMGKSTVRSPFTTAYVARRFNTATNTFGAPTSTRWTCTS